jgi:hypothetical protein
MLCEFTIQSAGFATRSHDPGLWTADATIQIGIATSLGAISSSSVISTELLP